MIRLNLARMVLKKGIPLLIVLFVFLFLSSQGYAAAPTITSLIPNIGPTAGGTVVTITGTNLTGTTAVIIGGVAATAITVLNASTVTAITPPGIAGVADVSVTTAGGTGTGIGLFTYIPAPTVTGITRASGSVAGGMAVTITGTNFTGATSVTIGGAAATSVSVINPTTISAVTPAGLVGPADVSVTTPGGTGTGVGLFTYTDPPTVLSISPGAGPTTGGTAVTIIGFKFTGATSVTIGGVAATNVVVVNPGTITAITPVGVLGTQNVTVNTLGGTGTATGLFTYLPPPPTITAITPNSGSTIGTPVTITGTNFIGVTSVTIFGMPAIGVTVVNPTTITAITPVGVAGARDVVVTTIGGTAKGVGLFTYINPPTITLVSPGSGPTTGSTSVTITGSNFTGATSVAIGGIPAASMTVVNDTTITAITPGGVAGYQNVTVTTYGNVVGGGLSLFTYMLPPTVTSITPSGAPLTGGTLVTITGSNFVTNATAVTIGGVAATGISIINPNTILATAPPGIAGVADVSVTTPGGTGTGTAFFRYSLPPTVTGITPASGTIMGGTPVTITGTNFTGTTSITIGGSVTTFTVVNDTTITAITPGHFVGGPTDVLVSTPGGTGTGVGLFTYFLLPTVTGIAPSLDTPLGGKIVTITGTHLDTVTSVKFGSTAVSFWINSANQITVTSPIGTPGVVDITASNLNGTSTISAADKFTYIAPPTVTAVSQAIGPASGGTSVVITGTGFTWLNTLNFGAIAAASYTVNSDTQVTAVSPPGVGIVDINVVNAAGGRSPVSTADQFTYVPIPTVTSVSPPTGPAAGGTNILITGTNFTGVSSVKFGTTPAAFIVNSPTQITATVPMGIGIVDITVSAIGGTSVVNVSDQFTYVPMPTVTGIAPNSGPAVGGTAVTITGTNLNGTTVVNFGAMVAASYTVNSATQVTAIAPSGIGTVNITITTAGGTSALNALDQFTYGTTVTGITPNVGLIAGGTLVTITGTNFTGATSVTIGGAAATGITVVNPTTITAIVPPGAAGAQNVVVTTPNGTGTGTGLFTYITAPTVTGITPTSGSYTGGTLVTITGTNFTGATSVSIGSSAATGITVVNPTTITAIVPPGTAGPQNIIVTAPGGIGTGIGLFTYIGAAAGFRITSITQQTAGGAFSVTITATDGLGNTDVAYQPVNNLHFVTTAGVAPNGVSVPVLPVDSKPVFVNGVATITGFTLYKAETAVTISVSELTTAKTGSSNLFNVDPAPAATLRVQ